MSMSQLDPGQIIKSIYDPSTESLKTIPGGGQLVTEKFDYIAASYPDSVTEVYSYYFGGSGGTLVSTVTVVYTDDTKVNLASVTKS